MLQIVKYFRIYRSVKEFDIKGLTYPACRKFKFEIKTVNNQFLCKNCKNINAAITPRFRFNVIIEDRYGDEIAVKVLRAQGEILTQSKPRKLQKFESEV